MEHQYPGAISGDENMLAELMLPDQAHVRNQDWTIFFLHKDTSEEAERAENAAAEKKKRKARKKEAKEDCGVEDSQEGTEDGTEDSDTDTDGEHEEDDAQGVEGPPLIYVLNLVNTKQDTTAKRFVHDTGNTRVSCLM